MADTSDRPDTWKTLGKLAAALVAAGVLVAGLALPYVGGIGLVAGHEADKFDNTVCTLPDSKPPQKTTLYASDGKTVLATLFSQDRVEVGLDQIPQGLQDALVATEDRRFYSHHGVDLRGLLRSAVSTTGGSTQGGSTLTMQYVKQIRYYEAGNDVKKQQAAIAQNINRKMEDARCAIYIENTLKESKQQILQNYLNIAFFGENSYGIQTAAKTYFNKNTSQLTLGESAMLVGLLRAPTSYDPFINKAAAKIRRDEVIDNLVAVGKISAAVGAQQKALPIALATDAPPTVREGCGNSDSTVPNVGFFCDYVRNWLINNNGISDNQLQTGGLKIVTTLDAGTQTSAQTRLQKDVPASSSSTAVLPVVDPRTGNVLAMAASKQYGTGPNQTEQPLFTARVAPGASTYKLFTLLAALQAGVPVDWTLATVAGNTEKYVPKNCTTKNPGASNGDPNETYTLNETLRSASAKSSNTFFLGLADQFFGCDLSTIVQTAKNLGITSFDMPSDVRGQTIGQTIIGLERAQVLTLGSVATSPLELTGAYAGVANLGMYNAPSPIMSITDSSGNAMSVKRNPPTQVVPAQAAANAIDILNGDTQRDGTSAQKFAGWYSGGGSQIAGKTGTAPGTPTTENGAIWFTGMTPTMTATSAVINLDNPSASSQGLPGIGNGKAYGDYAAGLWVDALTPSLKKDTWKWTKAADVSGTAVPDVTGESIAQATSDLQARGYKVFQLGTGGAGVSMYCPSSVATGNVGYFGPSIAPIGATITICQSSGVAQPVATAAPAQAPNRGGTGNRNGGNTRTGNTPGGGRSNGPTGG